MPDRPPVCDYEGSDYQRTFWEAGGREYEDRVEAIALQRMLPPGGGLLLEAGAGAGRNTQRYQGFERVVLLDYSRTQLAQAQERLGKSERFTFVAGDIYRLPFTPGVFDAATMIRTLHHMADAQRALGQMRSVLKTGAIFILEYANKQNGKAILRYLLGRQASSPFSEEPLEFAPLNFDFHPRAIRAWLGESDFEVERQLTVSHFRLLLLKRWLPLSLLVWMDSLAQLTGDWWQLTPSVFVRARALEEAQTEAQAPEGALPVGRALGGELSEGRAGIFRCPECGHFPLAEEPESLPCPACGRRWAIRGGIYDFREPL